MTEYVGRPSVRWPFALGPFTVHPSAMMDEWRPEVGEWLVAITRFAVM